MELQIALLSERQLLQIVDGANRLHVNPLAGKHPTVEGRMCREVIECAPQQVFLKSPYFGGRTEFNVFVDHGLDGNECGARLREGCRAPQGSELSQNRAGAQHGLGGFHGIEGCSANAVQAYALPGEE